ncbi:hypothetical protein FVD04_06800 [Campylobacter jejuni]|uniref:P-loop NTPase fold protein n=1 Tax=Campylobacter coli TaxID=195 RepID=UPI0013893A17|nr:hypothetical protein [Campylobacter jejuni]ECQ6486767.1 hypothetical protein [Campylobacter coli]EIU9796018.1 hypothetical protein [Campylobacter coli]EJQ8770554.1 hypothetical protein [Campylobacter jejuni]EMB4907472.1 hypothetical protein [Campylobacter jejuni]
MEYKQQIKNFLEDEENYSLLISGSWGVGKTYLWKEIENEINPKIIHKENLWKKFKSNINFLNHLIILFSIIKQCVGITLMSITEYFNLCNYIKNPNKQVKNIVYVSLFGKEHYKEVLEEITLKAYKHNKILYFIRNITFWKLSVGTFLQLFITKNFKNIIVCLDDLERKSDKLDIKDILGLINQLKEEKCKVILISNKDELSNNKEKDKEIFDTYKEKCIDLNIHIRSKTEVVSQILKEKNPEIPKEIIPDSIYQIENLRNLNKIIKALEFFNKELQLADRLEQNKEYEAFFIEISKKIILEYENMDSYNLNEEKQQGIPLPHIFLKTINSIIKDYTNNGLIYSMPNDKKEDFEKELKEYMFYRGLSALRKLLEDSIQSPNGTNKNKLEIFFNSVDEKQLDDFVYELGFINFIALDRVFHFDKNERKLKMKKYCLELVKDYKYDEKFINIICNGDETLKQYYKGLEIKEITIKQNNFSKKIQKIQDKHKYIKSYSDFYAHLEKINKSSEEEIRYFLNNKMIFSYCDIYFSIEEANKSNYPRLYSVYKSFEDEKKSN